MAHNRAKTHKVNISAITGRYVTQKFADKNPKTTVQLTVRNPKRKK